MGYTDLGSYEDMWQPGSGYQYESLDDLLNEMGYGEGGSAYQGLGNINSGSNLGGFGNSLVNRGLSSLLGPAGAGSSGALSNLLRAASGGGNNANAAKSILDKIFGNKSGTGTGVNTYNPGLNSNGSNPNVGGTGRSIVSPGQWDLQRIQPIETPIASINSLLGPNKFKGY